MNIDTEIYLEKEHTKSLLINHLNEVKTIYNDLSHFEKDELTTDILADICDINGVKVIPDGFVDLAKDINNINTKFVKEHKDDLFYVITVSDDLFPTDVFETKFHPNGNTGCIEVDDDYMFGIRCNHLIWIEGYSEIFGYGYFIVGNHKGATVTKLVGSIQDVIDSVDRD